MSVEKPKTIYRADYREPDYWIDRVHLHFELGEERTLVRAKLSVRRNAALIGDPPPLVLAGEELKLRGVWLDSRELAPSEYVVNEEQLSVTPVPTRFELETLVEIRPQDNTTLSGLYKSSGNFCTQCEAMGFRRITYFLDRPDVMARFTTVIDADAERYPVLLSNGNAVEREPLERGRHRVVWEDPHPKPCYLFALVAGDLSCHSGSFTTASGRQVKLEIWVEPQNIKSCEHALRSLQKAMKWDEETFGLEYDLDVYMIVAVNDFNMGAMENKGLNIFNSKYVLARPETATDDDYEGVEAVIAHEYFHNWTGNRVTCRDWFQLTLKEGLTVYRDQCFTADMTSAAVKRIRDVTVLRTAQFAEDSGPMAHPIRPESYISMDNFYTVTVYEKGAEVVRLYRTLLGEEGFRRGMDLYFERHDGQAVTCDDFRAAMADANGTDLSQFERWYSQAGTPLLKARGEFDAGTGCYTLDLEQRVSDEIPSEAGAERPPLHIPVSVALLGSNGDELSARLDAQRGVTHLLELTGRSQRFLFSELGEAPAGVSLLRDFSAPVRLESSRTREDLAFLMSHDSDPFNRWDAGQELAKGLLLELCERATKGGELTLDPLFSAAFGKILADPRLDDSLKALALMLPSERILAQDQEVVQVDSLHESREFTRRALATEYAEQLEAVYHDLRSEGPYRNDREAIGRRRLRNCALAYLASIADPKYIRLLEAQFCSADNMTDRQASLSLLVDSDCPERERALADFYAEWRDEPLVLDKWFSVQAQSAREDAFEQVQQLCVHADFNLANPNRVRSLVGVFCSANQVRFHRADGAAYRFLIEVVIELDARNPQLASRLVSLLNQWRRFDPGRAELMQAQLERLAARSGLSKDVFEIVERALKPG